MLSHATPDGISTSKLVMGASEYPSALNINNSHKDGKVNMVLVKEDQRVPKCIGESTHYG